MKKDSFRFWAFISYSHQDKKWGDWLHRALETYRVPKSLVGEENGRGDTIPRRVFPVFRDREELPTSADLGDNIHEALIKSRYLIVICSPHAAASRWVDEEIRYFKSLGRENRILCLIVDGEPNAGDKPELGMQECFPDAVKFQLGIDSKLSQERVEPIAADARKDKDEKSDAKLKILAGLLGIGFDRLKKRDQRRRRQRFIALAAFLSLLLLTISGLGATSFFQWRQAEKNLIEANHNYGLALLEKAETAEKNKDFNAANLYALYAQKNLKKNDSGILIRAERINYDNPIYPIIFRTPISAHHKLGVTSIAFSSNGSNMASSSLDGTVILWDVSTGQVNATLKGHSDPVLSVSFSPDGKIVASGSSDGTVILWDTLTGLGKTSLIGHKDKVLSVSFSPDRKTLASGSYDNTVIVWDIATGQPRTILTGHTDSVLSVAYGPDGKTLASGSSDGTVILWDTATGEKLKLFEGHRGLVNSVSYSPNGKTLASGTSDGTVILWDILSGKKITTFKENGSEVFCVSFSPDGKLLAASSYDETITLWNIETEKAIATLKGHTDEVKCLSFSPDSKILASGSYDKTLILWDVATSQPKTAIGGHKNGVSCVAISPDGKILASGSDDETVILWDIVTGKINSILKGHTTKINSLSFSPDGKTLASGAGARVMIWDVMTGKREMTLRAPDRVRDIAISPDGKILAVCSGASVILWGADTGKKISIFMEKMGYVDCLAFSPDGKTLAYVSKDISSFERKDFGVIVRDVVTGQVKDSLKDDSEYNSIAFLPDNSLAISSYGMVKIWFRGFTRRIITLKAHANRLVPLGIYDIISWDEASDEQINNAFGHVCVRPDGKILASGLKDMVILWDVRTGEEIATLKTHAGYVSQICFSPDGNFLYSGSSDGTVTLWNVGLAGITHTVENYFINPFDSDISFSPDGKTLALPSSNGIVALLDVNLRQVTATLNAPATANNLRNAAFSPDGKTLASGSYDNTVFLWDLDTEELAATLKGDMHPPSTPSAKVGSIRSVSFSPDSRTLASGSKDTTIMLWDVRTRKIRTILKGHKSVVTCVAFSPDGKTLASGSFDNTVILWDIDTGQAIATLKGHLSSSILSKVGSINSISFSPDGRMLASGGEDNTIILWNAITGQMMAKLKGHTDGILSVCFSPDGKTLASGSSDSTVILWDIDTKLMRAKFRDLTYETKVLKGYSDIYSVSFSPDGDILAAVCGPGPLILFDLTKINEGIMERINDTQSKTRSTLKGIDFQSGFNFSQKNIYLPTESLPPHWPREHPFHWLENVKKHSAAAMLQLGIIYDRRNNFETAMHWYQEAALEGEKEAEIYLDTLEKRRNINKKTAEQIWIKPLRNNSDQDEALYRCNTVIELYPDHIEALWTRGNILITKGDFQEAEHDIRRVCQLAPQFDEAHGNMGWLLIIQDRFKEALPFSQKAHDLDQQNWEWTFQLGLLHMFREESLEAYAFYRNVIDQLPKSNALSDVLDHFNFFISNGKFTDACHDAIIWFRTEFEKQENANGDEK